MRVAGSVRSAGSVRIKKLVMAGVAGLALALVLAGCTSNDALTGKVKDNYSSADGTITTISAKDRGKPITFTGTSDAGETISSKDYLGQVVVVNFWYAGCAPCRAEAPMLEKAYQALRVDNVAFVGVNTIDQPDTSRAFAVSHDVTYPSVIDANSGSVRLAFAGKLAPSATPTTMVLDTKGRIAARVLSQLDSPAILEQLVNDVLAEGK
ncbi:MAG: alkyl hydroperoxide reductase [Microbacteriaceae bacterium]|nr:alkyl hydroperoxide reductase [Microbacteriaceae bacterium]